MRLARLGPRPSGARLNRLDALRVLGAVVSCVLIFSQSFAALHFALIPHRLCALHGLEDTPVLGARPRPEVAPATRRHRPVASSDTSSEGAHERCVLLSTLHERVATFTAGASQRLAAPAGARAPAAAVVTLQSHRLAVWRVAPKQGPPA